MTGMPTMMPAAGTRARLLSPAVAIVYAAGLLQGLTMVSFPALSATLVRTLGLDDAQYGAIFLPQVACAVAGAVAGGSLAARIGLKRLLAIALVADGASQLLLAATAAAGPGFGYPILLLATALLGLGFGLIGAPINSYPPVFFPGQPQAAVIAVHTLLGLGLASGPVIAGAFTAAGHWAGFPLLLVALCGAAAVLATVIALPHTEAGARAAGTAAERHPSRAAPFWLFGAIAVLYAFAEGTFANWAVIYLGEAKGLPPATAGLALSVFWGALVAGRLLVSVLVTRVPAASIWISLPGLMIAVFLLLPSVSGPATGIGLFCLAGLACSAFFPLTITLASERFPEHIAWVSSMLIAALMIGVGTGAFLIGALRTMLALEDLYRLSACYPLLAVLLALVVLRRRHVAPATAEAGPQ
jgi:fucose permease